MTSEPHFSVDQARDIGELIGIDWAAAPFDVEQFRAGMDVELEHGSRDPATDVTGSDPVVSGKIALAHLNEFPDYYARLAKMEADAERDWVDRGRGRPADRSPAECAQGVEDHGEVDDLLGRARADHDAVDRDDLAAAHEDDVAHLHLLDRDLLEAVADVAPGDLRRALDERGELAPRARRRHVLERRAAREHQPDDDAGESWPRRREPTIATRAIVSTPM